MRLPTRPKPWQREAQNARGDAERTNRTAEEAIVWSCSALLCLLFGDNRIGVDMQQMATLFGCGEQAHTLV